MGYQVIRQPDGKLALWSTVVDSFVVVDATTDEIVEFFVQRAADEARYEGIGACALAIETGSSGLAHRMTWDEALAHHQKVYGKPFDPAGLEEDG